MIVLCLSVDELLDRTFRKVVKIKLKKSTKFLTAKHTTTARINAVVDLISLNLNALIKEFDFNKTSQFYYELADLLIGIKKIQDTSASVRSSMKIIKNLRARYIASIKLTSSINEFPKLRREAYGRICSVVNSLAPKLEFLKDSYLKLKNIPTPQNLPTAVVAGYPNVGKSSVVRKLSSAKPEVAQYPFTTKALSVGYFEAKRKKYQIIDSPGLLDRELSKRNKLELQAILALRHLANCIVFIIDPTFHCGYASEPQLKLLKEVYENFKVTIIEIENKCDILKSNSERLKISAKTGKGLDKLKEEILKCLG